MKFATKCIHAGQEPDIATGAVMTPIYQTSTYAQESIGKHKGYEYARTQNPTRQALESCLAALENGKYGLAFSSGMAAISCVCNLLKAGDHVVVGEDIYGGTYRLFVRVLTKYNIEFTFVDARSEALVEAAIQPNTKMLWLETPTNPLLRLADIKKISALAAKHKIHTVVDNTFASPYFQNPLDLGAQIVVHSTTKYLGGHSDVVGGACIVNDEDLYKDLKFHQNAVGGVPGPMDCFLVLRGIKTLSLRAQAHERNAIIIANYLMTEPLVEQVYYPGLTTHPQHELAKSQMSGFGGMVSFVIKGDMETTRLFTESTKVFTLAESLGGVESLMCHPVTMTHASVPEIDRVDRGIVPGLIRLSIGIEDIDDLLNDLKHAFAVVNKAISVAAK